MIIVTKISEKSQGILRFPGITLDFSDCLRFLCCRWISVLYFLDISEDFSCISLDFHHRCMGFPSVAGPSPSGFALRISVTRESIDYVATCKGAGTYNV